MYEEVGEEGADLGFPQGDRSAVRGPHLEKTQYPEAHGRTVAQPRGGAGPVDRRGREDAVSGGTGRGRLPGGARRGPVPGRGGLVVGEREWYGAGRGCRRRDGTRKHRAGTAVRGRESP
ncbi:hypothetical protein GCM10022244_58250 [Streptomyces gulbargensis]|uniref:Uncharacterized protein n=1 Tax=Streptomyces gulbargensis TaxID=364901 RepID=A0ABP7NCG9_9ACTN